MHKLNLLIVDDHPLFRKGIISVIKDALIFEKIFEASTIKEVFDLLKKEKIDFITLDLNLPDGDGINIIEKIDYEQNIPILVITTYNSQILSRDVLKKGAKGYIAKENISDNLIDAINTILRGGNYLDATAEMLDKNSESSTELYFTLTKAEKAIFKMIAEGKTSKEIAFDTGRSVKTIENQRGAIMKKLNLKNETELVKLALKLDIIDL
ncbi:response regulator [Calditerrivibrio nitroreducens]|uniref:response regulator n=1 Tax=Calditerrivibrio nitroreducens TaxID=477976 RepID=UPI003C7845BC